MGSLGKVLSRSNSWKLSEGFAKPCRCATSSHHQVRVQTVTRLLHLTPLFLSPLFLRETGAAATASSLQRRPQKFIRLASITAAYSSRQDPRRWGIQLGRLGLQPPLLLFLRLNLAIRTSTTLTSRRKCHYSAAVCHAACVMS